MHFIARRAMIAAAEALRAPPVAATVPAAAKEGRRQAKGVKKACGRLKSDV